MWKKFIIIQPFYNDYKIDSIFSNHLARVKLDFYECLQFLFVRNFSKKEIIKMIPPNYFPYSPSINDQEKYICVGTKEG